MITHEFEHGLALSNIATQLVEESEVDVMLVPNSSSKHNFMKAYLKDRPKGKHMIVNITENGVECVVTPPSGESQKFFINFDMKIFGYPKAIGI